MVVTSIEQAHSDLRRMIAGSEAMVGFTGAGISTESGIPDFRSKDTAWQRNPPMPLDQFLSSKAARIEAWRRKFSMDDSHRGAQPNTGHKALAHFVERGRMRSIITQNIDGLHEASGVPADRIIELHGNGTYAKCLQCEVRYELEDIRTRFEATGEPAECWCGGIVKTATISFGQSMPEEAMRRAQKETLACDLFFALGSSLVVFPAAEFPVLAKHNGAKLVIINKEETRLDAIADLVIRAPIGEVLAPFSDRSALN